jgi:hypothetical protein
MPLQAGPDQMPQSALGFSDQAHQHRQLGGVRPNTHHVVLAQQAHG